MTRQEIEQELDATCRYYGVTRAEMARAKRSCRPSETRYLQMARGAFIVRASRQGACPRDIGLCLGITRRTIQHWRTEMLRRGLVERLNGKVLPAGYVVRVKRQGRAA